jgi:ABC-type glycerol-3-phosphate transport system substrate-binding protein
VTGKAPALAQTRILHVLEWSSFVPAADVIRDQQAAEFGKQAGVKVTLEHINANDLAARATAAIEGRKGPDILQLLNNSPHLYAGGLEDHTQLIAELGGDKFYPFIMDAVQVEGIVRGVPYFFGGGANTYRKDIFQKAGIGKLPETWEEHLTVGKTLKKFGMPIRSAMRQGLPIPCCGPLAAWKSTRKAKSRLTARRHAPRRIL